MNVPDKQQALFEYTLRLGDNTLILAQRLSEWCGHGPFLEEDIALANTALDLLGQARMFLTYAGEIEGKGRTEDQLAYFRDEREWRNLLIVEQPRGDFAHTIASQFLLNTYLLELYSQLQHSKDERLAAIAAKAIKETHYHLRHSTEWMLRLGEGTEESHRRLQSALDDLWRFTGEMFQTDAVDRLMQSEGVGVNLEIAQAAWESRIRQILEQATLQQPQCPRVRGCGRDGLHSEHMGHLLAEMQFLQRAYPGLNW